MLGFFFHFYCLFYFIHFSFHFTPGQWSSYGIYQAIHLRAASFINSQIQFKIILCVWYTPSVLFLSRVQPIGVATIFLQRWDMFHSTILSDLQVTCGYPFAADLERFTKHNVQFLPSAASYSVNCWGIMNYSQVLNILYLRGCKNWRIYHKLTARCAICFRDGFPILFSVRSLVFFFSKFTSQATLSESTKTADVLKLTTIMELWDTHLW